MAQTLIHMPEQVRQGAVVRITAMIAHPMETGLRLNSDGRQQPRNIIRQFVCSQGGRELFSVKLFTSIAANPLLAFQIKALSEEPLQFAWTGDEGFSQTEIRRWRFV
jgi:sulfur-oxidizing protein SoxZ